MNRRRYVARYLLRSPAFLVGVLVVAFWCVAAVAWRRLAPFPPFETSIGPTLTAPTGTYWLGTDDLGRDVWSRVLAGSYDVLTIAPPATVITIALGVAIAMLAVYYLGIVDALLMRSIDLLLVFPPLVIALLVVSALGASKLTIVFIIGAFGAAGVSRTVRSAALRERERDYVSAARLRGENGLYIMCREILPNLAGPIIVETTFRLGFSVFAAASLSFLGVSMRLPAADWGLTITTQRVYLQVQPWSTLGPALALASLVIAVNLITDGLRKAFDLV